MTDQSTQDVITPELAKQIRQYQDSLEKWRAEDHAAGRGAGFLAAVAGFLWAASFLAASFTGVVNQPTWFLMFGVVSFGGAAICTAAAVGTTVVRTFSPPPIQPWRGP